MKREIQIAVLILILLSLQIAGCGVAGTAASGSSMSAPPISLPTPVTGRISVSSPDEEGMISVIGEEGSVTGGATVMIINEGDLSVLPYGRVLGLFIGVAYATSSGDFPGVCYEVGHACALADSGGAFSAKIAGEEDDEIVIVIIDESTGAEKSGRLTREIPRDVVPFPGGPVDLAVDSFAQKMYVLIKGGEWDGTVLPNMVKIHDLANNAYESGYVDVGGTGAMKIEVGEPGIAVVESDADSTTLYLSKFDADGNIGGFSAEPLDFGVGSVIPSDMQFLSGSEYLLISNRTPAPSFYAYDFGQDRENLLDIVTAGLSQAGFTHEGSDAIAEGVMNNKSVVAFVSRFADVSGDRGTALSVYDLFEVKDWISTGSNTPSPLATRLLPRGTVVADIAFVDNAGLIIVTDSGNNSIYAYRLVADNRARYDLNVVESVDLADFESPQKMETVRIPNVGYVVFIAMENGDDEKLDTVLTIKVEVAATGGISVSHKYTPVGLSPTAIAYDEVNGYLYVSCFKSRNVARLPLSDVLPE